eukprot:261-Pyramimonas_sp.AAC.1
MEALGAARVALPLTRCAEGADLGLAVAPAEGAYEDAAVPPHEVHVGARVARREEQRVLRPIPGAEDGQLEDRVAPLGDGELGHVYVVGPRPVYGWTPSKCRCAAVGR